MHKTSHFFVKRMEYTEGVMLFTGKIKKTYFFNFKTIFQKRVVSGIAIFVFSRCLYSTILFKNDNFIEHRSNSTK